MNDLNIKNIIVTGGSHGIGFEISKHLASLNYRMIIISRTKKELANSCIKLDKLNNYKNYYLALDVSNLNNLKDLRNFLIKEKIEIDGLVNCAGVYGPIGNTLDLELKDFQDAFNINFFGTLNMIHTTNDFFKDKIKKKIINFSGGGASSPFPYYSAYATSKAAIVRLTENLAAELKDDSFDINCVAPGFVLTRLHKKTISAGPEKMGHEFYNNTKKMIKNGGVSPLFVCKLVSFLLSELSDGITGKFISANWDKWSDVKYLEKIIKNKDFATLRRIDDKNFFQKD